MQTPLKNEPSQTFSQPLIADSLQSYGGVQADPSDHGTQYGGAQPNNSFITSQRPRPALLRFSPVSITVLTTLATSLVFIVYAQVQLSLPISLRSQDQTTRLILIPFALLIWLAISSYILEKTAKLHLHNAFLKSQLRYHSSGPYWLHIIAFPCISAFFICNRSLSHFFIHRIKVEFPTEPTCVTLWSLVHFTDLYIILRLFWSCITHNYLRDHSHLFNIDPGQLGFIREQRWIISGVSELLMLETEQLRRLIDNPRFPSLKEQDFETSLGLKEEALESLQEDNVLLEVQAQGLRTTVANKHTGCEKHERNLQIHRTIERHNSSLLSRLDRRREMLEGENRKKQLLLKISREQLESSRSLHELIVGPRNKPSF